jgi:RHS repeat-associated protein
MNLQASSTCIVVDSLCLPRRREAKAGRSALRITPGTASQLHGRSGPSPARRRIILFAVVATLLLASGAPSTFADDHNPIGVTGAFEGVITTAGAYNILNHNARREIDDIVVPGSIGKYPLKMTRYYNSRRTPGYGILGAGWTHEYSWGVSLAVGKFYYPNGSEQDSSCFEALGVSDGWVPGSPTCDQNGCRGDFRLADGGTVHFDDINGYFQARTVKDPYGQTTTLTSNNSGYLTRVTEPGGRYLQFNYSQVNGVTMLSGVDAYDGVAGHPRIDWVGYHYTSISPGGQFGPPVNCLTSVDYSDGQHAYYTYQEDNVPEHPSPPCPCVIKVTPLLRTCRDVRYKGAMRHICYEYPDNGAHGAIIAERYSLNGSTNGPRVSKIDPPAPSPLATDPNFDTIYTETRGDTPTRKFTYTSLHLHRFNEDTCPTWRPDLDPAPQQFLQSYTDFQNHTTQLGYDGNWYVNSVTDANNHTTSYTRGPPPPNGIGEILTITHPGDGSSIQYTYSDRGHYLMSIIDERGNETVHTRDANHRITRTDHKDSLGNIIAFEEFQYAHNNFGLLSTHHLPSNTGWSGPYVHFQYDGRGLLLAKTNPTTIADWATALSQAPKTTYSYYTSGYWTDRVQTMTLPRNVSGLHASETYEYDKNGAGNPVPGRGLVTKIQHADLKYRSFGYDAYGNKLWEENELRKRTSYVYDDYNRVTSITDPLQKTETLSYLKPGASSSYPHTTSSVYTHTSRTGIVTTNVYDENFRKKSTKIGSSTTSFGYDNVGNPTTVTDPLIHTTTTDYDARNRKWHVRDALGHRTIFGYDPASNVISITRPDNRIETKGYDGMNRLIRHTVPKAAGVNLTTTFGYWPSGKLFLEKDPKQQGTTLATYFAYNESDQMIAMYYPDPTLTTLQQSSYDDAHNLASRTTVGGKTQSFTYDVRNRKITMRWDNNAEWANFGYDYASRLITAQNGTGAPGTGIISTVTREYDDAGRLTLDKQDIPGVGPVEVHHDYDDDGKENHLWVFPNVSYDYTFSYDPTYGRFETIKPTGGNIAFRYYYDAASNEIHRDNLLNGGVTQIYNRDSLNRIWRLDVKKGANLLGREDYGYDAMNRLVSVTREDNRQDQFAYWFDGELAVATYGANPTPTPSPPPSPTPTPPGGQVAEPSFNPPGRNIYPAGSVTVAISTATTGAQIRYTLDGTNWTVIANGGSVTFSPGLRGMTLTAIGFKSGMADSDPHSEEYYREDPGGGEAPDTYRTVVYYLDGAGNRTAVTDTLLGNATYAPNDLNQYTAVTNSTIINGSEHEVSTYQGPYDAQPATYTYINDEHLKQVSNGTNSYYLYYDALGRCVKRTLNNFTTVYLYDAEKPILEYNQNGQITRNVYGKGIDEILMRTDPTVNGGAAFYYQQDHEGSVTHLTNAAGNVIEEYRYDAFGGPVTIYSAGTYNNRFKFTGREYTGTFGFYEYRARAYHPGLGRFMSEDPKLFDAGDYNLFRYCHNDPIDFTDPMGLDDTAPTYSPRQTSQQLAADRAYNFIMGLMQRQFNSAISAGMAGYQAVSQLTKALGGSVEGNFYVRQGQLTLVDRSRDQALAVRMESGKGAATNIPEAEALKKQGPLPRGLYRILSRNKDGSQLYKGTGFRGYILAPIDSTAFNDTYDVFARNGFRMHHGRGEGCLTTCVPSDFVRVQNFLERSATRSQPSVAGWGTQQFYGILSVNTDIYE